MPAGQWLYSSLDEALDHRCRYDRKMLAAGARATGFTVEHMQSFNKASVPGWFWNGKILRRRGFSRSQLKLFDWLVPILRHTDRLLPWNGLGLIAVARRGD